MDFRIIEHSEECQGRLTRMLFELWDELRGDRRAPLPSDFDYLDCPDLITNLLVLKAPEGSSELEIKFTGSGITNFTGRENINAKVKDALERDRHDPDRAQFAKNTQELFDLCQSEGRPVLNGPRLLSFVPRNFIRFESLTVPFLNEARDVTQLVSIIDIADLPEKRGEGERNPVR